MNYKYRRFECFGEHRKQNKRKKKINQLAMYTYSNFSDIIWNMNNNQTELINSSIVHNADLRAEKLQLSVQVHNNRYTCLLIYSFYKMFDHSTNRGSARIWYPILQWTLSIDNSPLSSHFSSFGFDVDVGFWSKVEESKINYAPL